jgi:acyl carrier protein
MDDLEQRVIRFLADERALKSDEISLASTLQNDLGLDGNDAVELFDKFSREFHVDITPIKPIWNRYFGPEGIPFLFGLGILGMMVMAATLASSLASLWRGLPVWLTYVALLIAGLYLLWNEWRKRHLLTPISVGKLVQAARSGRWPDVTPR